MNDQQRLAFVDGEIAGLKHDEREILLANGAVSTLYGLRWPKGYEPPQDVDISLFKIREKLGKLHDERWELRKALKLDPRTGAPPVKAAPMQTVDEGYFPELLGPISETGRGKYAKDCHGIRTGTPEIKHEACNNDTFHLIRYMVNDEAVSGLSLRATAEWRGQRSATIAEVFTAAAHRRQGYAAKLLEYARSYFRKVEHSKDLTTMGRAWKKAVRNPTGDDMSESSEPAINDKIVYIATLINPVDHKPYAVTWNAEDQKVYIIHPPAFAPHVGEIVGEGYFEDDEHDMYGGSVADTGCPRSHTPGGVTKRGAGLGLMLYSGLALTMAYTAGISASKRKGLNLPHRHPKACISSGPKGRSTKATKWWEAQRERGYVEEVSGGESEHVCEDDTTSYPIDAESLGIDSDFVSREAEEQHSDISEIEVDDFSIDEDSVTVRYRFCGWREGSEDGGTYVLKAKEVLDSGMVIDANEAITEDYTVPSLEVMRGLDLSGIEDWGFLKMIEDAFVFADGTAEDFRRFLSKQISPFLSRQGEKEGRAAGAYRGYARNPVEHSKAWLELYGDLIEAEEKAGSGRAKENPVEKNVDPYELRIGIDTEMEHTTDRNIAKKIALDHLREHPKYYTKLRSVGLVHRNGPERRKASRRDASDIKGLPCPRCGSTDTRNASNYGRIIHDRMHCLACGMLWTLRDDQRK